MTRLLIVLAQITNPFPPVHATQGAITKILNFLYALIGAVALLTIVIAGLRFVMSQGDPQATSRARDAIIYAVVGLVVAVMAAVVTNYVLNKI
jgi:hypothetical protein